MDSRNTTFFSSVGTTLRRQGNREVRMSTVIAMGFGDHWSEMIGSAVRALVTAITAQVQISKGRRRQE